MDTHSSSAERVADHIAAAAHRRAQRAADRRRRHTTRQHGLAARHQAKLTRLGLLPRETDRAH